MAANYLRITHTVLINITIGPKCIQWFFVSKITATIIRTTTSPSPSDRKIPILRNLLLRLKLLSEISYEGILKDHLGDELAQRRIRTYSIFIDYNINYYVYCK